MTEAGFDSQSALARASGVPQPTINRILKSVGKRGPETQTIAKLAAACNVSFQWLHEGTGEKARGTSSATLSPDSPNKFDQNARLVPLGTRAIPVISAIQAGAMKEISVPYATGDGYTTIYVDDTYSQWAFGLEIDGDSMLPEYHPGDIVIIEPNWAPRPGDCVAAKNGKQEATFKKYRLRGTNAEGNDIFELVPLNDNYPTLRSDETPLTIIGVMAELRRKTRKR
ncbi:LexA family protein [Janthinobacterium lividum]|uniref:LexA family protein n=1 Tax=Janthinobacterium lividum TaxID=29581 RepID=UPI001595334B|nr:S24 family peptidase [Janthinobacterium lividum]MBH2071702.1 helix-turn-helix domain-containing protein [Burkholderiales bacterium]QKY09538.1 helix-turn-helix domain-containing protein [Janthinobacterium lividum]